MSSFFRRSASLIAGGTAAGVMYTQANVVVVSNENNSIFLSQPEECEENIRRASPELLLALTSKRKAILTSMMSASKRGSVAYAQQLHSEAEAKVVAGHRRDDLPDIDLDTIAQHVGKKNKKNKKADGGNNGTAEDEKEADRDRIYVTYKAGVYDITDFVEQHPGGKKRIMLAAGGSIEKYWQQVTIHNEDAVRTILESMRIGNVKGYDPTKKGGGLSPSAGGGAVSGEDDEVARLWGSEPRRAAALEVIAARPFNAQSPDIALDTFLTPNELFFVRNHMPVPLIHEEFVETTPSSSSDDKKEGGVEFLV